MYFGQIWSLIDEFLNVYWTTNLPDQDAPGYGAAQLCISHKGQRIINIFRSGWRSPVHAEELLIRHLRKIKGLRGPVTIEVFQNYSPCGQCARRYCQLLEDFKNRGISLSIEIHFVSLYRICHNVETPFDVDWYLTRRIHWLNVKGLQEMSADGIVLKVFSKTTWRELFRRMYVPLHLNFDRHYDKYRATNDSHCRNQLGKVLACPGSVIPEDVTNIDTFN